VDRLYTDFGRRLRNARLEAQLTQKDVAERVGLSRTSITNIERGSQHIALHQLFLLAVAVGCRPEALLPERGSAPEEILSTRALKALQSQDDRESREFATLVLRGAPAQVRDADVTRR
jgi:transcriptional regulator with XRE-family HTH domain